MRWRSWLENRWCVYWLRVCIVFTAPSLTGCSSANVPYFCEFLHHIVCEYRCVCMFACSCALSIVTKCDCLCLISLLLLLSAVACLPRECVINHERRVIIQMFACLVTVLSDISIHSWVLLSFRLIFYSWGETKFRESHLQPVRRMNWQKVFLKAPLFLWITWFLFLCKFMWHMKINVFFFPVHAPSAGKALNALQLFNISKYK